MLRSTDTRYGAIARVLHWGMALVIFVLIWLGWWMADLSYFDRWYNRSLELHKSLGMVVLAIAAVKIAWLIYDVKPDYAENIRPWERTVATAVHRVFYLFMLLIPATGYVVSTSAGDGISVFGLFQVPAALPVSESLRDFAIELHFLLAYGTGVLVVVHVLAALKHQFIDRDGTLELML